MIDNYIDNNIIIQNIIESLNYMLQYHIKNKKERDTFIKCINILCKKINGDPKGGAD